MKIRNLAIVGGLMVAAGAATIACSGDDDDTTPVKTTDAGKTTDSGPAADAGVPNHAAVSAFVGDVISDQIEKNNILLSYFLPNTTAPGGKGNKPSLNDIQDCLATQFGQVLGNGDYYVNPTTGASATTPSGYVCRASMSDIHTPLYIPGPVFAEFISAIVTEAATKDLIITSAQSAQITGLAGQIIDPNAPDAALPFGWNDAGDAATTAPDGATDGGDSGSDAGDAGDGGDADAG